MPTNGPRKVHDSISLKDIKERRFESPTPDEK